MGKKAERLTKIKYQFKKNFDSSNLSDSRKVQIVRSLMDGQIDGTDVILDTTKAPASLFGVDIQWNEDGKNVTLVTDTVSISDNLSDNVTPVIASDTAGLLYLYNGVATQAFKLNDGNTFQLNIENEILK